MPPSTLLIKIMAVLPGSDCTSWLRDTDPCYTIPAAMSKLLNLGYWRGEGDVDIRYTKAVQGAEGYTVSEPRAMRAPATMALSLATAM